MDNDKTNGSSCPCAPRRSDTISFIKLAHSKPVSELLTITGKLTLNDRLGHFLALWGVNRMGHIVKPGLYKMGEPTIDSPVFVSANYTLSFDAVRRALAGTDCYILVLDTKGVNVWCAAGKGTFGTEELVHRIAWSGLSGIVSHRALILPQLSAPGISAHEVQRRSGFRVEYGPVRASDLPEYIKTREATPEMRRVQFSFRDRLVLTPVELLHVALPTLVAAIILYLLAGPLAALAAITAVLAGTVFFPALLPFIPTHDFSTKGLILGVIVAIPFSIPFATNPEMPFWANMLTALVPLMIMPVVTAYLALNFTGCTTFTSRTGVKKEIYRYVPVMALMAGFGILLLVILGIVRFMKVI
ncbi:mercury methylation corrinoid protein HgcA [Methanolobus chelungpuianus]|uniref:CO dehydrogenase/acetyl-CoA synthase gamma subunit (Corrinoid Fe-S protein) n=1 Tax=Methanolobus chelungpuianus TaxID=502115 RepID=A0AAE3HBI7_9EURY|nr:mercury methylation corrinoid protein HgcA [Methanolobus chelungpuianus]MCQ6963647.1 CO dehydrogenase/acetyl-CoA synthase gamma subunit (corrinoid Fe-S protein) [Methanolobus chelungpuianus]